MGVNPPEAIPSETLQRRTSPPQLNSLSGFNPSTIFHTYGAGAVNLAVFFKEFNKAPVQWKAKEAPVKYK